MSNTARTTKDDSASRGRSASRRPRVALAAAAAAGILLAGTTAAVQAASGSASTATPITVTTAERRDLEIRESSVGQIEADTAPTIAAEIPGRVIAVYADIGGKVARDAPLVNIEPTDYHLAEAAARTDIERLQALIQAQRLQVARLRSLVEKQSSSQSVLDNAEARLGALRAQIAAARVGLQQARHNLERTEIRSPIAGRVDERYVSVGDYVKVGAPLFRITQVERLRVRLPFPESLGAKLKRGLPVRLVSPLRPALTVTAAVTELRPIITLANRAIDVIVIVRNPGGWEPGASVTGEVRVARRPAAVMVPEISVVRRPAGTVVYVIDGTVAHQRVVTTGVRDRGEVEIRSGLAAGATIAVDGAGFLSDGAPVAVHKR